MASFFVGKSGFGCQHGLERSGTVLTGIERSDGARVDTRGTMLIQTLTQTRARGCLCLTAAQVAAERRPPEHAKR